MAYKNTTDSWGSVTKLFHWLIALLILMTFILGFLADALSDSRIKDNIFIFHKSFGISVLLLVVLRFTWKLFNERPSPPVGIDNKTELLAKRFQWGLYFLIFVMPLSGWVLNSASGIPLQWFGWIEVPEITGHSEVLEEQAEFSHMILARILLLMLTGHIVMAMIHHYVHKNDILIRMLPKSLSPKKFLILNLSSIAILAILTGTFIFFSGCTANGESTGVEQDTVQEAAKPETADAGTEKLMVAKADTASSVSGSEHSWQIIEDESKLGFKATYAGTEFDGKFKDFDAIIIFDPNDPEAGLFDVDIDVTSITTYNAERDFTIGDPEWFNFSEYPKSKYVTKSIKGAGGNKYVAMGTLELKGRRKDVELRFTWDEYPNGDVKVKGHARMLADADVNRVDFGIGEGSWETDDTVGFGVLVKIDLLLKK